MDLSEFKEIQNYSRYLISPNGEVWDTETKAIRSWTNNEGVVIVASAMKDNGKKQAINIRRAVYQTFVDPSLRMSTQLQNLDGDFLNNHYSNIIPVSRETKRRQSFMELSLNETSARRGIIKAARSVWSSMMTRCYEVNSPSYGRYGGTGVVVCDDWHDFKTFFDWFNNNYIEGFALDKDLIVDGNKEYSPSTCAFIPQTLNSLLVHQEVPIVEKYKRGSYTLRCYISCKYVILKGWSKDECIEQYNLVRKLQLEKAIYLMKQYHHSLKSKYPTTPKIDYRVLNKLSELLT